MVKVCLKSRLTAFVLCIMVALSVVMSTRNATVYADNATKEITVFSVEDYICEADPFSRDCLQSGISFPVRSGIANALVKIPKATVSQVSVSTGLSKATVGMTYEFLVNGIDRVCEPTVMDIMVPINSEAVLSNREFACQMTSDGISSVSLMISLDYIDLDYGILGGYYSLGMQGPTTGGGTGYALFKTEFTTGGMTFRAAVNGEADAMGANNAFMTIQPGEYAVEPLEK